MFSVTNKDIKKISKKFSFSKVLKKKDLPGYIKHYILEDENVLVAYKTSRDHAVFTDNKIAIFDSLNKINRKEIHTVPYKSIVSLSITFGLMEAELSLYLEYGYPIKFSFYDLEAEDKVRLRLIYTYLSRKICNEIIPKDLITRIIKDDVKIKTDSKKFDKDPK